MPGLVVCGRRARIRGRGHAGLSGRLRCRHAVARRPQGHLPRVAVPPVSITVDDAAPVEGESTRNGVAAFPTQPGTWRIAVDPERGVGGRAVTFVTCDHTIAALGQVQTIEPTINTDQRSVSIDLDEGDALRCDFFFGPAPAAAEATGRGGEAAEPRPSEDRAGKPSDTEGDRPPEPATTATDRCRTGTFGGGSERRRRRHG